MDKTIRQEFNDELRNQRMDVRERLYQATRHMDTATFVTIQELLCEYAIAEWREGYVSGLEMHGYGKNEELMRRLLEDIRKRKEARDGK
jgi:hypothetical protein